MARPEYKRLCRAARMTHGREMSVEKASTEVQMMVNFVCHLGSSMPELSLVREGARLGAYS